MRNQSLKPQDVVLALHLLDEREFRRQSDYAEELGMSQAEISMSLKRLVALHLLDPELLLPYRNNLKEFIEHGVRYVFPAEIHGLVKGVATASSASPLSLHLRSSGPGFVWPCEDGDDFGLELTPLYPSVPRAALSNPKLAERLALVDSIRIGKPRERKLAIDEFEQRL